MLHRLGQLEEAISVFDHVLSEVTDDRLVYESRGLVFQDQGRHRRAVSDFTKAIQLDDDVGENYYHRGESMLRLRRLDEALEEFHTATRRGYGVTHNKYIFFFAFVLSVSQIKCFFALYHCLYTDFVRDTIIFSTISFFIVFFFFLPGTTSLAF